MQKDVDCFESCFPFVQWSSMRLMLILSIVHGVETRQVDYVNASNLDKEVSLEIPQRLQHQNVIPCVLKLHKSLHGMNDAPLMFFELLEEEPVVDWVQATGELWSMSVCSQGGNLVD